MTAAACGICDGRNGAIVTAREMMFGLRETFRYWECASCGCVQLIDIPTDMSRHYPADYYSYSKRDIPTPHPRGRLRRWAFQERNSALVFRKKGFWSLVARLRPRPDFESLSDIFAHTPLRNVHARILEVGCGSGQLLRTLLSAGFDSLLGVDPFIPEGVRFSDGLQIEAKTIEEVESTEFDLIMFNHSLEHMPDQIGTLKITARLLGSSGVCMIRIPIAGSDPWREYGADWVELDPPRHYYLHTTVSLARAAAEAGLDVTGVHYDGTSFGYWASELYRRDIPLHDGPKRREPQAVFSDDELARFETRAARANAEKQGGRATFILTRSK